MGGRVSVFGSLEVQIYRCDVDDGQLLTERHVDESKDVRSETLDTVRAVLGAPPLGGPMVGIVTPVSELTDALPHRARRQDAPRGGTGVHRTLRS